MTSKRTILYSEDSIESSEYYNRLESLPPFLPLHSANKYPEEVDDERLRMIRELQFEYRAAMLAVPDERLSSEEVAYKKFMQAEKLPEIVSTQSKMMSQNSDYVFDRFDDDLLPNVSVPEFEKDSEDVIIYDCVQTSAVDKITGTVIYAYEAPLVIRKPTDKMQVGIVADQQLRIQVVRQVYPNFIDKPVRSRTTIRIPFCFKDGCVFELNSIHRYSEFFKTHHSPFDVWKSFFSSYVVKDIQFEHRNVERAIIMIDQTIKDESEYISMIEFNMRCRRYLKKYSMYKGNTNHPPNVILRVAMRTSGEVRGVYVVESEMSDRKLFSVKCRHKVILKKRGQLIGQGIT